MADEVRRSRGTRRSVGGVRRSSVRALLGAAALSVVAACGVHEVAGTVKPLGDLPPIQDPAYFETVEHMHLGSTLGDTKIIEDGRLKGPHFNLRLAAVAVTDSLEPAESGAFLIAPAEGIRAARQHEFVLFELETSPDAPPPWDPGATPPSAVVQVGEQQLPFILPGQWDDVTDTYLVQSTLYVLSVPKGAEPLLKVTDDAVTQTLNLRTGERGSDAVALYYAPRHQSLAVADYAAAGVVTTPANGVPVSRPYTVTFSMSDNVSADLSPWVPKAGWAAPGRAWLGFGGFTVSSDGLSFDPSLYQPLLKFSLDFATTFTLTLPDGTKVGAQPGTIESVEFDDLTSIGNVGFNGYEARFDVPVDFATGTVSILPAGTMTAAYAEGDFPADWSEPPTRLDVSVDLGP